MRISWSTYSEAPSTSIEWTWTQSTPWNRENRVTIGRSQGTSDHHSKAHIPQGMNRGPIWPETTPIKVWCKYKWCEIMKWSSTLRDFNKSLFWCCSVFGLLLWRGAHHECWEKCLNFVHNLVMVCNIPHIYIDSFYSSWASCSKTTTSRS